MESGDIVAGNPKVFGELLQIVAPHLTAPLKSRRPVAAAENK
jgi:myo-inositol-1(or 4)-monophosphatase